MKKIIIASLFATIATLASAADWSGSYVDLSVDANRTRIDVSSDESFNGIASGHKNTVGISVFTGNNYQSGNLVYGWEIGASTGSKSESHGADSYYGHIYHEVKTNYAMIAKGRLGYEVANVLPYLTAGLVGASVKTTSSWDSDGDSGSYSRSPVTFGIVLGLGTVYMLDTNVHLRVEFNHVKYSSLGSGDYAAFADSIYMEPSANTFKLGVAYKF